MTPHPTTRQNCVGLGGNDTKRHFTSPENSNFKLQQPQNYVIPQETPFRGMDVAEPLNFERKMKFMRD